MYWGNRPDVTSAFAAPTRNDHAIWTSHVRVSQGFRARRSCAFLKLQADNACDDHADAYQATRHGYRVKDLVEQFDAKPAEIKALFSNSLDPVRTATLRDKMLAAGLPI